MDPKTRCVRSGDAARDIGRPLSPVIVPATTYEFESQAQVDAYYESGKGYLYSRYGSPTCREAERLLADLEGAQEAACFSSGMAAIHATLAVLGAGGKIASQRELYGGTLELLRLLGGQGLEVTWLDLDGLHRLAPGDLQGCAMLYLETPVNPTLRLVDLQRVCGAARAAGCPVVVDSTFATPILQRPLEWGADLVVHSATKYLGGHGDLTGGVVAGARETIGRIAGRRRLYGGLLDAFSAFLLLRGAQTLGVRMEAHCRGAQRVAEELARHPAVERVFYPGLDEHPDHALARRQMNGFGGMVSATLAGGLDAAVRAHDRLRLFRRAASLGGAESLVSIPARMSHRHLDGPSREALGIAPGLLRLSVGIEAPEDLVADLRQALE